MPNFLPPPPGTFQIDFGGLDTVRSRDCVVFIKGDAHPVVVSQAMVDGGWPGGQAVQWTDTGIDDFMVTYSKGLYGGFLIWGSDETADQYTGMTRNQLVYQQAVMMAGRALISTSSYERYTYASRTGGGPLVPLVYQPHDILYFSRRGLWTNEDELSQAPVDPFAPAFFTGFVMQIPKPNNSFFLGIQTSL